MHKLNTHKKIVQQHHPCVPLILIKKKKKQLEGVAWKIIKIEKKKKWE